MTVVSAHELQRVVICKESGCENDRRSPVIERGPYAGLCDEHYEAMRAKMSKGQSERRGLDSLHSVPVPGPIAELSLNGHKPQAGSLREAVQACLQPAGDLDRALTRKQAADGDAQRARGALAEALRALQAAVQEAAT